jgi:hypothetical protein
VQAAVEVTFEKPASVGMTPEAWFPSASVTVADSVPGLYSKLGSWGSTSSANEPSFCEVSPETHCRVPSFQPGP